MYQVLYRKYRPQTFDDVYGQNHITSTLKNEIINNRISHAYLFTGTRGTGKTTCAKIFAKAVNCENPQNGEPCNVCPSCKGVMDESMLDVVEMDAASNNGVDDIREIIDEIAYSPSRGKYRVYIIDEVHMLTTNAFNALLKTLEEPPEHAIFILATTEIHKVPATVLSRCQRFDFKRITPEIIADRLEIVSQKENIQLDRDAAILIARVADGAMRDALSILDQCTVLNNHITTEVVSNTAGIAGRDSLFDLSDAILVGDSSKSIGIIGDLYQNSFDMQRLTSEMVNHFRNMMLAKMSVKNRELVVCTDDEYARLEETSKKFSYEKIMYVLDTLQDTYVKIKQGANGRIEVELAFAKLCNPKLEVNTDAILSRLADVERTVKFGVKNMEATTSTPDLAPVAPQAKVEKEEKQVESTPVVEETKEEPKVEENTKVYSKVVTPTTEEKTTELSTPEVPNIEEETKVESPTEPAQESVKPENPDVQVEFDQWGEFMDELHSLDVALFGVLNNTSRGYIRGEFFLIESNNQAVSQFLKISTHAKAIKKALYNVTGKVYKLGLFKKSVVQESTNKVDPLDVLQKRIADDGNTDNINFD